jgi:hypothetical protein
MVKLHLFNHQEAFEYGITKNLTRLEPVVRITERCNCIELYGEIKHVDGGNYHTVIEVYEITPEEYVVSYGDTRELFDVSEWVFVVVQLNDEEVGYITLKSGEIAEVVRKEEVEELLNYKYKDYEVHYIEG